MSLCVTLEPKTTHRTAQEIHDEVALLLRCRLSRFYGETQRTEAAFRHRPARRAGGGYHLIAVDPEQYYRRAPRAD